MAVVEEPLKFGEDTAKAKALRLLSFMHVEHRCVQRAQIEAGPPWRGGSGCGRKAWVPKGEDGQPRVVPLEASAGDPCFL